MMLKKNIYNKKGFSLVEAVVTIAILGIVLPLIYKLMFQTQQYSQSAQISAELQLQANRSMRQITTDISSAIAIFDQRTFTTAPEGSGCNFLPQGCLSSSSVINNSDYNTYNTAKPFAAVNGNLFTLNKNPAPSNSSAVNVTIWPTTNSDEGSNMYTLQTIPSSLAMMVYKKDDNTVISGRTVPLYKFVCYYMALSKDIYYDKNFLNETKYYRRLVRLESKNFYYKSNDQYDATETTKLNVKGYLSWNAPEANVTAIIPTDLSTNPNINKYNYSVLSNNIAPNSTQPNSTTPDYPANPNNKTINSDIIPVTGGLMFFQNDRSVTIRLIVAKGINNIANIYSVSLNSTVIANNLK